MTIEEFDKMQFKSGLKAKYKGVTYDVVSVDFHERRIALELGDGEAYWVRCENVLLV